MTDSKELTHYESPRLGQFFEELLEFIKPVLVGEQRGLRDGQTLSLRVRALGMEMKRSVM